MAFAREVKRIHHWPEGQQLNLLTFASAFEFASSARKFFEFMECQDKAYPEPIVPYPPGAPGGAHSWDSWRFAVELHDCWAETKKREYSVFIESAQRRAEAAAIAEVVPSWGQLRKLVYARDKGICAVCGQYCEWEYYHLGHLWDRMNGGPDEPHNLVVMCNYCNLYRKPLHHSIAEAETWLQEQGFRREHKSTK